MKSILVALVSLVAMNGYAKTLNCVIPPQLKSLIASSPRLEKLGQLEQVERKQSRKIDLIVYEVTEEQGKKSYKLDRISFAGNPAREIRSFEEDSTLKKALEEKHVPKLLKCSSPEDIIESLEAAEKSFQHAKKLKDCNSFDGKMCGTSDECIKVIERQRALCLKKMELENSEATEKRTQFSGQL